MEKISLVVLSLIVLIGMYWGWRVFWFLTDDAYIAFRYVSNSFLGYGYVWNPPPFKPVEGYTSLLWVAILDGVWRLTGVYPPASANVIALIFSFLTLGLCSLMVLRINWEAPLRKYRVFFLGVVCLGIVSNRTFLAWTSSGMETALFNFLLILWIYCVLYLPFSTNSWLISVSTTAAILSLSRPDGILMVISTVGLLSWQILRGIRTSNKLLASSPLLIVPLHYTSRRVVYGQWLPNTYYAKSHLGILWVESGGRYFLSFVIEYALWFWIVLFVFFLSRILNDYFKTKAEIGMGDFKRSTHIISAPLVAVSSALIAHFLYYTFVIGGDHFEYRVYSHLIFLGFVSFISIANYVRLSPTRLSLIMSAFVVFSWVIPWTHWISTRHLDSRQETGFLKVSVAQNFLKVYPDTPVFIVHYLDFYDRLQFWLIDHAVCMRHQEHKVFHLYLLQALPSRDLGLELPKQGYPVLARQSVGVVAWVLPYVNIIDTLGLNDSVISHNPAPNPSLMAHERQAPAGYVECFEPNVEFRGTNVSVLPRSDPLSAEKIIQCEEEFSPRNNTHTN